MAVSTAMLTHLMQLFILSPITEASAGTPALNLLKLSGQVNHADVEERLQAELEPQLEDDTTRLRDFEKTLAITYNALPKNTDGTLGHEAVRYVLHRAFAQRRGWFIRGLEPNSRSPTSMSNLQEEWVPAYLQALLERQEQQHGEKGTSLKELAAMAAAIEDLAAGESGARLKNAYKLYDLSLEQPADEAEIEHALMAYYIVFLNGGNFSAIGGDDMDLKMHEFTQDYAGWPEAEEWMRDATGRYLTHGSGGKVDFVASEKLAIEVAQQFYTFNDKECSDLKKTLMSLESGKAGRVRLSAFYQKAMYSHWHFTEKADYLRTLGALDETEPGKLQVITANYLMSRPNCLDASGFYAVCCRNECEDLMAHLEQKIGNPHADASQIVDLVSSLPSDTVSAPRVLTKDLLERLDQIALRGNGSVPLHGRLFAQWMHHVYPRECPFPHMAGTTTPQTPDEWMQEHSQTQSEASTEEMYNQVERDTCAVSTTGGVRCDEAAGAELPWVDVEELLTSHEAMAFDNDISSDLQGRALRSPGSTKSNALAVAAGVSILAAIFAVSKHPLLTRLAPGLMVMALVLVGFYSDLFDFRAFAVAFCGGLFVFAVHSALSHVQRSSRLCKADKCCV